MRFVARDMRVAGACAALVAVVVCGLGGCRGSDPSEAGGGTQALGTLPPPGFPHGPDRPALPPGWRVLYHDAVDLALSADGRFLAAGDLAGTALLYDLTDGHFVWGDKTELGVTPHVAMAATGARFFAGQEGGDEAPVRVLDVASRTRAATLGEVGRAVHDVASDRDGVRVAVLAPASAKLTVDDALVVYEVMPGRATVGRSIFAPPGPLARGSVALSPDGAFVAVASNDGRVAAWKIGEAAAVLGWRHAGPVRRLAFGAVGATLWVSDEREIRHWDLAALADPAAAPVVATTAGEALRGLVALSDGRVIGVGHVAGDGGGLAFYDGQSGAEIGRAATGCRCERHAVSADAKTAVCLCADATEIRWGPTTIGPDAAHGTVKP